MCRAKIFSANVMGSVALAPLLYAMNSGGFQTSGGYVGFAW